MITMIQLTEYQNPDERFLSQYGEVTNRAWWVLEKNRIEKTKGRVALVIKGKGKDEGKYALWVNDVGVAYEGKRKEERKSLRQLKWR